MFSARPRFSVRRLAAASAFSAIALMLSVYPAAAQTTVVSFDPASSGIESTASNEGVLSYNLGYSFTVNAPITVTALGFFADPYYYDPANPYYNTLGSTSQAYAISHDVGIYTSTGTLLLSATVSQSDALVNNFRYASPSIGPNLTLLPNTSYIIAGVTGTYDPFYEDVQITDSNGAQQYGIVTPPEVTYGGSVSAVGNSLTGNSFQSSALSNPGLFGPNFQFNTLPASAAPEPGQWSVLALAALGLGTLIVRVRRRAAAAE